MRLNQQSAITGAKEPTTVPFPPAERLDHFIARAHAYDSLTRAEAAELLACLLVKEATDAQITEALRAFATKGETSEEVVGIAETLRARMVTIPSPGFNFVDTAGMGGSRAKTFNVSTAAALVAAAAGVPVAKHGNHAFSSKSGSADVMLALGAQLPISAETAARMLESLGFCFLFAPTHHPALMRLAVIRKQLAIRTILNLAGPLANPANAKRHLLGASDANLLPVMAAALKSLGAERAWVVHGSDGLDEITLTGPTLVAGLHAGSVREFSVTPRDFGLPEQSLASISAPSPVASARIIRDVFENRDRDAAYHLVVINAAAAMHIGGFAGSLKDCGEAAAAAIASGAAAEKLNAFLAATRSDAE